MTLRGDVIENVPKNMNSKGFQALCEFFQGLGLVLICRCLYFGLESCAFEARFSHHT